MTLRKRNLTRAVLETLCLLLFVSLLPNALAKPARKHSSSSSHAKASARRTKSRKAKPAENNAPLAAAEETTSEGVAASSEPLGTDPLLLALVTHEKLPVGLAQYCGPIGFKSQPGAQVAEDTTVQTLMTEAYQYLGTRYVLGGTTPSGFDCSGFVRHVFASQGIELNRCSREQAQQGSPVTTDQLAPGDLLFFNTQSRHGGVSHVGIYIGDGQFIHAGSGRKGGVRINELEESYYKRRLVGARRVM